jgi:DNA processing protein
MPFDSDCSSWLALTLVPGLGNRSIRKLLVAFGAPEAILNARREDLQKFVSRDLAGKVMAGAAGQSVEAALRWLDQENHHVLTLADPDYPRPLLEIADPPVILYVAGRRQLVPAQALAVVGSRNPTPQGRENAETLARTLSDASHTVVSGLAEGIDTAAHRGGLAGAASTIAVVGTGLDRVYPARNLGLARLISEQGAVVSEFPLGTRALPGNFPRRNRIISGLSKGCLVIEATLQSGSLITARCALEQGREVFAVPGSIHSPLAKGCHALIKQGAKLVETAADILEELGQCVPSQSPWSAVAKSQCGNNAGLLDHVGYDPVDLDAVCGRSGLPPENVMANLLELELSGLVSVLPGGLYQRRR